MSAGPETAGRIVAHRNDRMGGRLISILNAIRVSRDYDIPFIIAWVSQGRTAPELRNPGDIFAPDFLDRYFVPGEDIGSRWSSLEDLDALPLQSADALRAAAQGGTDFLSQRSLGATVLPWEDAGDIARALPECFGAIGFCDTIRRVCDRIDDTLSGEDLTAYHIRRGDIISNPVTSQKLWPNKYIPREFYEIHLQSRLASHAGTCVLFSDTDYEVQRLKPLGPRVVSFDDLVSGEDLLPGQRDFLELFAMSRCREIFGPPNSAFSQTAATLGRCKVHPVRDSLTAREYPQAMELLIERMEVPEQHFLGDGDLGQCFPFVVDYLKEQGRPGHARNLLAAQVNRGFVRPYIFPLMSELSVDCGNLPGCLRVRDAAWARPVSGDEALGRVAAHAAMAHLEAGEARAAHRSAQTAWWFGPMDRAVPGVLNSVLSAGWMDVAPSYPIDPRMVRRRGNAFPGQDPHLSRLNDVRSPDGPGPLGNVGYPWEIALRDWSPIHGKRVGRGYANRSHIRNALTRLEKTHQKIAGSPELRSAASVMLRDLGELEAALASNAKAHAIWPEEPLYLKREADILLEAGQVEPGLARLEAAVEASDRHPCYLALLGHWYGKLRQPVKLRAVFAEVSEREHDLIEVHLMTSDILRRRPQTRERALTHIEAAVALAHGSHRLLTAQARILSELERYEEAEAIFLSLARSGTAQATAFAQMYRLFDRNGLLKRAEAVIAESPFDLAEIQDLVTGKG